MVAGGLICIPLWMQLTAGKIAEAADLKLLISHFQRTPALVPGASGILRTDISLAEAAHVLSRQGYVSYQYRLLGGFPRLWRHLCRLMSHYRGISCDKRKEPVTGRSLAPSPSPLANIEASSRTGRAT